MDIIGIICEYNPFHNGHIYHLNKIKEMYKDSTIVLIMSSSFTERGIPSIMNKWDKTSIALKYGVDLVIELPYIFSTQSADIFAKESINLLKELKVNKLIFGSESNDIEKLKLLANTQINDKNYNDLVKKYLDTGINYPTAMNKALKEITGFDVNESNDLLGLSYIKEIIKQNANIEPISIKRTNDYLSTNLDNDISSATAIREGFINNKDIKKYVPIETFNSINKETHFMEDYFKLLKYKINTSSNLEKYLDVDEGIENRIYKYIDTVDNYNELVEKVKTKRYTYNKINRMFSHILCGFTKEMKDKYKTSTYIRILGLTKSGQNYLNKIKKDISLKLITKFTKDEEILLYEKKVTSIYSSNLDKIKEKELIEKEYKQTIIRM